MIHFNFITALSRTTKAVLAVAFVMIFAALGVNNEAYGRTSKKVKSRTAIVKKQPATLLDLFYGMHSEDFENYYDSELDKIPGLIHRELKEQWEEKYNGKPFDLMLGFYIDSVFPSKAIQKAVFERLDSLVVTAFEYDASPELIKANVYNTADQANTLSYIERWKEILENMTKERHPNPSDLNDMEKITSSRGCTVCHKVYEDDKWVTYIMEESYFYHGGIGCPSWADYVTFNKETAEPLTVADVVNSRNRKNITRALGRQYNKARRKNGFPAVPYRGKELIELADGVALVNEGILFYYYPYTAGCAAEGQYNLIIPKKYL